MTFTEDEYAAEFRTDLRTYQSDTERHEAKKRGEFGASDFVCHERQRRIRIQAPETDQPDGWAAFVGTALDKELKAARRKAHPNYLYDAEWSVTLGGVTFNVHPDEVNPGEPSVTDYKCKDGLAVVRAGFMDDSARLQRHLQYLGGVQAGVLPPDGIVRNAVVDRSGADPSVHVEQEPFSLDVIGEAVAFLFDVNYAIDNGEETHKDWPRPMCRRFCPYYTSCRGSEIVSEHITDPSLQAMVDAYGMAKATEKEAAQLQSELRDLLDDVAGYTDLYEIHWTTVNRKTGSGRALHVTPLEVA